MSASSCLGSKGAQRKRPKTLSQCTQATVHSRLVEFSWKELLRRFSNALKTTACTNAEALEICVVNQPFKCKSSLEVRSIFTQCSESGWAFSAPAERESFHQPHTGFISMAPGQVKKTVTWFTQVLTGVDLFPTSHPRAPAQQSVNKTPPSPGCFLSQVSLQSSKERMQENPGEVPSCSVQLEHFKWSLKMKLTFILSNSSLWDVMFDSDYGKKINSTSC